jgi:lysozyme
LARQTLAMIKELTAHLIEFEGMKTQLYKCTSGKNTIGVGRNLDDRGISEDEAMILLGNDIKIVQEELLERWPWIKDLPPRAQMVMMDLGFNMGVPAISNFQNMLRDLQSGNWEGAAINLLDSKYATQVGRRAIYNAHLLETADDHTLPLKVIE